MALVLFHPKKNTLELYPVDRPPWNCGQWLGWPWIVWSTLEIAIAQGWIVVGEL